MRSQIKAPCLNYLPQIWRHHEHPTQCIPPQQHESPVRHCPPPQYDSSECHESSPRHNPPQTYQTPLSRLMKMVQDPTNININKDCRKETHVGPYCEECKGIAINATSIECCDLAKKSVYFRICSMKRVVQKRRCPYFPCHMETTEELTKPCLQLRRRLEEGDTHDIRLDGKNRMEWKWSVFLQASPIESRPSSP